jgi:hypothetical protein
MGFLSKLRNKIADEYKAMTAAAKQRALVKRITEQSTAEANLTLEDARFHGLGKAGAAELLHQRLKQRGLVQDEVPRSGLYQDGDDDEREDW